MRDVRWTDIPALDALERRLFPDDAWSQATWWSELAGRPRRSYVVEQDAAGAVVAYGGLALGGDVADVMTVAVAPEAQGRGLGRAVLEELVARARSDSAEHLMLEVRADNEAARKLYDNNGFEVLTVRRRYYQPGDVDALVMRRSLTGEVSA
ncbi:ribosomal protein S18-alanine N-acetyltransferase [Phycicoccus ginsengisoli]